MMLQVIFATTILAAYVVHYWPEWVQSRQRSKQSCDEYEPKEDWCQDDFILCSSFTAQVSSQQKFPCFLWLLMVKAAEHDVWFGVAFCPIGQLVLRNCVNSSYESGAGYYYLTCTLYFACCSKSSNSKIDNFDCQMSIWRSWIQERNIFSKETISWEFKGV